MIFLEKRESYRKVFNSSLSVAAGEKSISGEILNISIGGYCFYTLSPVNTEEGLISSLIKGIGYNDYIFSHANIVHSSIINDYFLYGVSFKLIDRKSDARLKALVSQLKSETGISY